MLMIMTVVPVGDKAAQGDLTQAFDIQDPTGRSVEERLTAEGGLDEILQFIARCQRRFDDVLGESVVFVNFQESDEGDGWIVREDPETPDEFAPSIN